MDWEIYDGLQQRGPMPEEGVFDAIRSGLPRNAYVRQRGATEWLPIETQPLFATALRHRGAAGSWPPPALPPPPPLVGAVQGMPPPVPGPSPALPYAVSAPNAGQPARRKLVGGGCLVQGLGGVLVLGAGGAVYAELALAIPAAAASLGLALLLLGGLLNLKWVCSLCRNPVGGRSMHVCPTCHASLT
jgi:hypothetical protein